MIPSVRPLRDDERGWLRERLAGLWGSPMIVSRGRARDAAQLPALVSVGPQAQILGLATYEIVGRECELVSLDAFRRGAGIGTELLRAVADQAQAERCARLWLVTTNDNLEALGFYQARGLRLVALRPNAIEEARRLKPQIPLTGLHGIPIRDELELELRFADDGPAPVG